MRLPLRVDQDIGRLEVAVHDKMRMRVRDGTRHLHAEFDACAHRESGRSGVRVDGLAVDIFQRQERAAVGGDAGIVKAGDIRVRQRRQDLAFACHALGERCDAPAHVRQLQRDLTLEETIGSICQPDARHAALANLAQQPIRADERLSGRPLWRRLSRAGRMLLAPA